MSSFPPEKWQIRFLKDMDSMTTAPGEEGEVSMEALMAIKPSQGEEGSFRFVLAGKEHIKISIMVQEVLQDPAFKDISLEMQLEVGTQIVLEKNSTCSKWIDLVELVQSQDIDAQNRKGENVSEDFLEIMENHRKKAPATRSGICLRWLLGCFGEDTDVFLIAQMLPCNKEVIDANPALNSDHTRGMVAAKYQVQHRAFDGVTAAGKSNRHITF